MRNSTVIGNKEIITTPAYTIIITNDVLEATTFDLCINGFRHSFTTMAELNNWLEWA